MAENKDQRKVDNQNSDVGPNGAAPEKSKPADDNGLHRAVSENLTANDKDVRPVVDQKIDTDEADFGDKDGQADLAAEAANEERYEKEGHANTADTDNDGVDDLKLEPLPKWCIYTLRFLKMLMLLMIMFVEAFMSGIFISVYGMWMLTNVTISPWYTFWLIVGAFVLLFALNMLFVKVWADPIPKYRQVKINKKK